LPWQVLKMLQECHIMAGYLAGLKNNYLYDLNTF